MDGLEAIELRLSKVLKGNLQFRFDSEYFKKKYLAIDEKLKLTGYFLLKEISKNHNHLRVPIKKELRSHGKYPYYGAQGINSYIENYIFDGNYLLIAEDGDNLRSRNNDIAFSVNGKFWVNNHAHILSFDNFKVEQIVRNYLNISPLRSVSGVAQPKLSKENLENIKIPKILFNDILQQRIEEIVKSSHQKLEQSKTLYKQSEELLLKELDLLNFKPSKENIAIKTFSQSFGDSGRLDSEYYQPKYDEIVEKIKNKKYDILINIVNINKSVEPGSEAYQDNGIPFLRVSNLTKFGLSNPDIHLSKSLFNNEALANLQPKKDTILLSKDGTVGIAYNIKQDTNIITSGAILHLTIRNNDILPEYLTLILNSLVVQMQSQRDAGGSIIKHWKPSEIGEVLIPIIENKIQIQIEQKIQQSFKLKEESKQLLELAKKAVEVAIEQDETQATKLINAQV